MNGVDHGAAIPRWHGILILLREQSAMIRNLLNRDFVTTRFKSVKAAADKAHDALDNLHESAVQLGKQYNVEPEHLARASNALSKAIAEATHDASDAETWMPRDPDSAILQAALERFYR